MAASPTPSPAGSPWRSVANRQLLVGGLLVFAGGATIALGSWVGGVALLAVSAPFAMSGVLLRASGGAVPALNAAYDAALGGRIAEAERLLDQIEADRPIRYVLRVAELQRANLAFRRGDLDAAEAKLDTTLARPPGMLTRQEERTHVLGAHAMRALILASKGESAKARADIEAVRSNELATVDSLARAAVAEAILIERGGDREALAAHLAKERRLLYDHTAPRERAIVRAYQRMLEAQRTSVYRHAAPRDHDTRDEPPIADWIARVAPAAAPFVRVARSAAEGAGGAEGAKAKAEEEVRVEPGLVEIAKKRVMGDGTKKSREPRLMGAKVAALWVLVCLMIGVLYALVSSTKEAGTAPNVPDIDVTVIMTILAAVFAGLFAFLIGRNVRRMRRLGRAVSMVARGDEAAATVELTALAALKNLPLVSSQARRELARLAERRADFEAAIAHCDEALEGLSRQPGSRALAAPIVLPDLIAERAYALAATGRYDKARAEMEMLRAEFPSFPYKASAELRVLLMERVKRGDFAGAVRVLDARSEDVPLPLRDEVLADLARSVARPESRNEAEIARITRELRTDSELRAFVEAVAPALVSSFFSRSNDDAEREAEAEREALAEEEAAIARAS